MHSIYSRDAVLQCYITSKKVGSKLTLEKVSSVYVLCIHYDFTLP